jgi:hypothetical protein
MDDFGQTITKIKEIQFNSKTNNIKMLGQDAPEFNTYQIMCWLGPVKDGIFQTLCFHEFWNSSVIEGQKFF